MNERPRPPIEPSLLTPEYWDGHSPEDNCELKEAIRRDRPSFWQEFKAERYGRRVLREFLALADREPVRSYAQGELFDANQFPEGTIIEVDKEWLLIRPNKSPDNPYWRDVSWGVFCGYDDKDARKVVLMRYIPYPDSIRAVRIGEAIGTTIRVGEVDHTRVIRPDHIMIEGLERVRTLQLYKFGKGAREEAKRKISLPDFGSIFRRPQPETS